MVKAARVLLPLIAMLWILLKDFVRISMSTHKRVHLVDHRIYDCSFKFKFVKLFNYIVVTVCNPVAIEKFIITNPSLQALRIFPPSMPRPIVAQLLSTQQVPLFQALSNKAVELRLKQKNEAP